MLDVPPGFKRAAVFAEPPMLGAEGPIIFQYLHIQAPRHQERKVGTLMFRQLGFLNGKLPTCLAFQVTNQTMRDWKQNWASAILICFPAARTLSEGAKRYWIFNTNLLNLQFSINLRNPLNRRPNPETP